jgi:hypothetical protein
MLFKSCVVETFMSNSEWKAFDRWALLGSLGAGSGFDIAGACDFVSDTGSLMLRAVLAVIFIHAPLTELSSYLALAAGDQPW